MPKHYHIKPNVFYNLSGDKRKAAKLEKKARSLVGYLMGQARLNNQKYRLQSWNYSDGSKIEVRVWNNALGERAVVRIWAPEHGIISIPVTIVFWMESGAFVYGNFIIEDPATPDYYIGTPIVDQYTPTEDFNGDSSVTDADIVCPIGEITFPEIDGEVSLPVPFVGTIDPRVYETTPSTHIRQNNLLLTQYLCPPSIFTGKLRLYVQSLYGSARTDYGVTLSEGGDGSLRIGQYELKHSGRTGTVLITTPGYQYWLADIALTSDCAVTYKRLVPVSTLENIANSLRNKLQALYPGQEEDTTDTNKSILETLLLSCLAPTGETGTVTTTIPVWSADYGNPLYYSWKATWDGLEASIVLVTADPTTGGIVGDRLVVELEYNEPNWSLTVTAASKVTGSGNWMVWIPETMGGGTSILTSSMYTCTASGTTIIPSPPTTFSSLPIYGWYNSSNIWVPVTLTRESSANLNISTSGLPIPVCGFNTESTEVITANSNRPFTVNTITVGAVGLASAITNGTRTLTRRTVTVREGAMYTDIYDAQGFQYHSYSETCETGLCTQIGLPSCNTPLFFTYQAGIGDGVQDRINGITATGLPFAVIPSRDCEAIYWGSYKKSTAVNADIRTETGTNLTYPAMYYSVKSPDYELGGPPYVPGETIWSGSNSRSHTTGSTGSWGGTTSTVTRTVTATKRLIVKAALKSSIQDIVNAQTGEGSGDALTSNGGDLPSLVLPGAEINSGYASDWEAFWTAPIGVCSSGVRDLALLPTVTQSAIALSISGYGRNGLPATIQTDGYTTVDAFVGWA